ncbi:nitroreductase family protein [Christensenella intestinihominis]|uniref:nitroreductase family protein n=1 Tax=Christensenella intestinihominis TaxID=1851429 RepID=UPI00082A5E05|nr:nitroreductase family protein [Christensenella intestinihominis]
METMKAINRRKSVRSYTGEKISREALDTVLQAAYAAPVGMGKYENFHLTVIENREFMQAIEEKASAMFGKPDLHLFYGAPTFILVSSKPDGAEKVGGIDYCNTAAIVENMSLAATDLGVGHCYIWGGVAVLNANPDLVARLNLPEGHTPCSGIILGVTTEEYTDRDIPGQRIGTSYLR